MADKDPESGSAAPETAQPVAQSKRWWPWLLLGAVVLLVGVGVVLALRSESGSTTPGKQPETGPLDGKLSVVIARGVKGSEPLQVEEPGALPVRAGGRMSLQVNLGQPAFSYLVWFNCEGQVVPLYPWNHDAIEVTDINRPPPVRKASDVLHSPPIGGGWEFGKKGGLETVLLLARRTPLDEGTQLGSLLGTLPVPKVRHRGELAVLGLDRGADSVSTLTALNRGTEDEARAVDEPLRALMLRLRDHFDVIRAVRFAHVEESEAEKK